MGQRQHREIIVPQIKQGWTETKRFTKVTSHQEILELEARYSDVLVSATCIDCGANRSDETDKQAAVLLI